MADKPKEDSMGIKWGEDPERDCKELIRLEAWGLYPHGHHKQNCPIHIQNEES